MKNDQVISKYIDKIKIDWNNEVEIIFVKYNSYYWLNEIDNNN